jgi:hypothetical protein
LVIKDHDIEDENDERGIETVTHPPKYSIPIKKQIFRPLLIQCWELQNEEITLLSWQRDNW